jgi:hypothetical protein
VEVFATVRGESVYFGLYKEPKYTEDQVLECHYATVGSTEYLPFADISDYTYTDGLVECPKWAKTVTRTSLEDAIIRLTINGVSFSTNEALALARGAFVRPECKFKIYN